jgi:Reverse transcriptase (RNA-dependent DNA polymerase)
MFEILILLTVVLVPFMDTGSPVAFISYDREMLLDLRHDSLSTHNSYDQHFDTFRIRGFNRYRRRGRRSGAARRVKAERSRTMVFDLSTFNQRTEPSVISVINTDYRLPIRRPDRRLPAGLIYISTAVDVAPHSHEPSVTEQCFATVPSVYLVNSTSLAKAHAMQHLTIDLMQYKSDVGVVTETWFKLHHDTAIYQISGYTCYRRDRKKRRGGGVAIFISSSVKSEVYVPPGDDNIYEILWIKTQVTDTDCFIGALYHPPKPVYNTADLLIHLEQTLDTIISTCVNKIAPIIILSGDFNQLDNSNILSMGLQAALYAPTHKGHSLDRIYTSEPLYDNIKVVKSTVTTEHRAVVARADDTRIVDYNKTSSCVYVRRRTPGQHAAVLQYLQTYSWQAVCVIDDVQSATDLFYRSVNYLLDTFYPMTRTTVTSRDPGFVTPEVKKLLRRKNALMRMGRLEEANSISIKISKIIIDYNSVCFKDQNSRSGAKELWDNIRSVTGRNKKVTGNSFASNLTADQLNAHYSTQSTDLNFVESAYKVTCISNKSVNFLTEMTVFNMLDKLKSTAAGADGLPYWLLKLIACSISQPLTHLYNTSLCTGVVPSQWKKAIICPIAKIPQPETCADFRPISLTPIVSRLLEKSVVKQFIYPIFEDRSLLNLFSDQFAFRPTGSTEAAIISIMHHITILLSANSYVRVIALDFSKAFDTVRHSRILSKLSNLPVDDHIYNWFVNYFKDHSHVTKYREHTSDSACINASVFQGSAIGPPMFVLNGLDLKPTVDDNFIDKYADDTYLIVSSINEGSIPTELQAIERWASDNNLMLNKKKSLEMIVYPNERKRSMAAPVASLPDICRVDSIKVLGVIIQNNLSMKLHVSAVCQSAAQSLYALKVLKAHGLDKQTMLSVCRATVASRLTYAVPAWWGFASADDKQMLQAVLNRAIRWGYYDASYPTVEQLSEKRDGDLFAHVLSNRNHVLYRFLPPETTHTHNLRARVHKRQLPKKSCTIVSKNFIHRMLYKDIY